MKSILLRYATPLITGLFLVSLISGVALFFHLGGSGFRGMHEWLSMLLIVPFGLHLWKNWRPMLAYLQRAPMAVALVMSAVMSLAFFVPQGTASDTRGGPPQFAISRQILNHSPAEVAPALGTTPEAMVATLTAAGFTVSGPDQTLLSVAAASGKSDADIMATLVKTPG